MTIKKLTVAAAIAVGIATCSLNSAMAACPCAQPATPAPYAEPLPVVTGPACPCDPAPKCDKCNKAFDECDCKRQILARILAKTKIHARLKKRLWMSG